MWKILVFYNKALESVDDLLEKSIEVTKKCGALNPDSANLSSWPAIW